MSMKIETATPRQPQNLNSTRFPANSRNRLGNNGGLGASQVKKQGTAIANQYSQLKPQEVKAGRGFGINIALACIEYTALTVGTIATLWLNPTNTLLGGALGVLAFRVTRNHEDQLEDVRLFATLGTVSSAYVNYGLYSDFTIPLSVCSLSLGFGSGIGLSRLFSGSKVHSTIPSKPTQPVILVPKKV